MATTPFALTPQGCAKICMLQHIYTTHIYTKPFDNRIGPSQTLQSNLGHSTGPEVTHDMYDMIFGEQDDATRLLKRGASLAMYVLLPWSDPNMSEARNTIH